MTNYREYVESNILREEVSRRGGGIEVDLSELLGDNHKMTAYQNYLGGGLLGSIQNSYNFDLSALTDNESTKLDEVTEAANRYFHALSNGEAEAYDEWGAGDYEAIQSRPGSAY